MSFWGRCNIRAIATELRPIIRPCSALCKLLVYYVGIFLPFVLVDPHLHVDGLVRVLHSRTTRRLTFLNVLSPANILPPVQVVYLRSGGAKILIRMSFTASRWTSCSSRSPKPFVRVEPPDKTMLLYSAFRRSISVRAIASTTIWCTP